MTEQNAILSAEYLFSADVVFHQCQSKHGSVFLASVITREKKSESSGLRKRRFEDVVERN